MTQKSRRLTTLLKEWAAEVTNARRVSEPEVRAEGDQLLRKTLKTTREH